MKTIKFEPTDGINAKAHRKENHFFKQYTVISLTGKGTIIEPITLRLYGTNSATYACLWIHGSFKGFKEYVSANGSGRATGYGYDRSSAAVDEAIQKAGIQLSESISARGETAVHSALTAIAEYLKLKNSFILTAHA